MDSIEKTENGLAELKLEGDCSVERAVQIQNEIKEALDNADGLELDLSQVTKADVSLQQLICSAHRSFAYADKPIRLTGQPSEPVLDILKRGGFGQVCLFALQECLFKEVIRDE